MKSLVSATWIELYPKPIKIVIHEYITTNTGEHPFSFVLQCLLQAKKNQVIPESHDTIDEK